VLIVEDAEAIRLAVQSALQSAGHAVRERADGRQLETDLAEFRWSTPWRRPYGAVQLRSR
jgi:DNA-binding response OmpR family regulator